MTLPAHARLTNPIVALLVIGILAVYAFDAHKARARIPRQPHADEAAYLQYAKHLRLSHYKYEGDRNRMPVYPFLLSTLYRVGMDDEEFLIKARIFNVNLTIVLLLALFCVFRKTFPPLYAIALLLVTAFGVFIYRAAFVNVEPLFYLVAFIAFVLLVRMLVEPGFILAIIAGIICGIAFLTKASALAALPIWVAMVFLQAIVFARSGFLSRALSRQLGMAAVLIASFLISVWPYIWTSKQRYGAFFYNVNSAHYMWCDSWPEALSYSEQLRTPKSRMAAIKELPSANNYFRTHSIPQTISRLTDGLGSLSKRSLKPVGYYKFILLLGLAAAILIVKHLNTFTGWIGRDPAAVMFVLLYLIAYTLLYAWYGAVVTDSRFVLTLFLPLVFSLSVVIAKLGAEHTITLVRREASARTVVAMILIGLALIDVAYNALRTVQA
jgi:hypothetical protein